MSIIRVVACIGFVIPETTDAAPVILFGADEVRRHPESGKWAFRISNTSAIRPEQCPYPGISLLYGHRSCLDHIAEMQMIANDCEARGEGRGCLHVATILVDVGAVEKEKVCAAQLPFLRFCSIRRMKADAQKLLVSHLAAVLAQRGDTSFCRIADIRSHTARLGEVLDRAPFSTIEVFIYPAVDQSGMTDYFAYLKPTARVVQIEQNTAKNWIAEFSVINSHEADRQKPTEDEIS